MGIPQLKFIYQASLAICLHDNIASLTQPVRETNERSKSAMKKKRDLLFLAVYFGGLKIRPPANNSGGYWKLVIGRSLTTNNQQLPRTKNFLATGIFLAVYFGGPKIRPPSWSAKWPQKTVRVMDRFVLAASNTTCNLIFWRFMNYDEDLTNVFDDSLKNEKN
ncbi:hypothetical protein BpHYR1_002124 [Brachionus plicatilis]|uniref:Uncharacterized protein n=1 Tax=Brachionus plicatilis TaxID=10195 RepID=A0A3M7RX64_BRAPC|nr:hypothetical protein BpHYR1_002124 [Brachionus plicatilis]